MNRYNEKYYLGFWLLIAITIAGLYFLGPPLVREINSWDHIQKCVYTSSGRTVCGETAE